MTAPRATKPPHDRGVTHKVTALGWRARWNLIKWALFSIDSRPGYFVHYDFRRGYVDGKAKRKQAGNVNFLYRRGYEIGRRR